MYYMYIYTYTYIHIHAYARVSKDALLCCVCACGCTYVFVCMCFIRLCACVCIHTYVCTGRVTRMSQATPVNASCHTYAWFVSHRCSQVTHVNTASPPPAPPPCTAAYAAGDMFSEQALSMEPAMLGISVGVNPTIWASVGEIQPSPLASTASKGGRPVLPAHQALSATLAHTYTQTEASPPLSSYVGVYTERESQEERKRARKS